MPFRVPVCVYPALHTYYGLDPQVRFKFPLHKLSFYSSGLFCAHRLAREPVKASQAHSSASYI